MQVKVYKLSGEDVPALYRKYLIVWRRNWKREYFLMLQVALTV